MGGDVLVFVSKPGAAKRPHQLVKFGPHTIWESALEYGWSFPVWDNPGAKSQAMRQYPRGQAEFNRALDAADGYEEERETFVAEAQALRIDILDTRVRAAFRAAGDWYFIGYRDPASKFMKGTKKGGWVSDPAVRKQLLEARLRFIADTPEAFIEAFAYQYWA